MHAPARTAALARILALRSSFWRCASSSASRRSLSRECALPTRDSNQASLSLQIHSGCTLQVCKFEVLCAP